MNNNQEKIIFTDGSKLMTEALVRAGADIFIGYPITPANLLYQYGSRRYPHFMAAPDEITTLQWMCGYAASGLLPVTATSFPGFALMLESVNMAFMMELPMVIILVQRLGPATGTATCGAQGDISLLNGCISGGYTLPVISTSSMSDCWDMAEAALKLAADLRSPVILLSSKEEVMTYRSFDINKLKHIDKVERKYYNGKETYQPYRADEKLVPDFVSLQSKEHRLRLTASTHDKMGILQNTTPEALENTLRIHQKAIHNMDSYLYYEISEEADADVLLLSYGISSDACREAQRNLNAAGKKVSLLIAKTLLPVHPLYYDIIAKYRHVVFVEENHQGLYKQILFGHQQVKNMSTVNAIGRMVYPSEIMEEVMRYV